MANLNRTIADLRLYLGPYYKIEKISQTTCEINSPFLNHLADNYRVFVEFNAAKHQYNVNDDCDALNEFEMLQTDTKKARQYIQSYHLTIDDDAITEICDEDRLIEAILLNLNVQMGLDAIQQTQS